MTILVSGSLALDHIMVFRGRFGDHILPDRVHALNVSFHVPELRRTWGGCAANIAFNMKLLGDDPLVLATVGSSDFTAYAGWLDRHGQTAAGDRIDRWCRWGFPVVYFGLILLIVAVTIVVVG